jgi:hypothetical protein
MAAWRGVRASADFRRPAAAENPVGQRTGCRCFGPATYYGEYPK